MALNKIYRGGVHRTTPETVEINYTGAVTSILPGAAVALDPTDGLTSVIAPGAFWYVVGEELHGGVNDNLLEEPRSTLRLYTPRSGDLYAVRAAAGVTVTNDLALTINAEGQFAAATEVDEIHAYVQWPPNSSLTFAGPTVADQLIPIKIK